MNHLKSFSQYSLYYIKHSEIIIDFFTLFGIYFHTYLYQKNVKLSIINSHNSESIISFFLISYLFYDLAHVYLNFKSTNRANMNDKFKICLVAIIIIAVSYVLFKNNLHLIHGYSKTFFVFGFFFIIGNLIKLSSTYFTRKKFIADVFRLFDPIWIINMILISITDPITNTNDNPNEITFYEIYFRYMEYHLLIMAFILIYNDRNIDEDVQNRIYSTSAVIGKYDSFRFTAFIILSHYFFIFINGLAFDLEYFKGFSTLLISFYLISMYRQRRMIHVYASFIILIICNLYFYAKVLK